MQMVGICLAWGEVFPRPAAQARDDSRRPGAVAGDDADGADTKPALRFG